MCNDTAENVSLNCWRVFLCFPSYWLEIAPPESFPRTPPLVSPPIPPPNLLLSSLSSPFFLALTDMTRVVQSYTCDSSCSDGSAKMTSPTTWLVN